jgi:hypothetical protein
MGITNIHDYVARVEQAVRDNLRGARIIGLIELEITERPKEYWERIFIVAWNRDDQSGTHRVNINSNDESACFMGHYDLSWNDAVVDMLKRANLEAVR